QGLRGIAIISVLLFHLLPDLFINGYLGVDVFFVLSGYLISSILSKHEKLSIDHFLDFYKRRFERIIPLYATLLLMCLISSLFLFSSFDVENTRISFVWSLILARNLQQIHDSRDYWKQSSNSKPLLLHLWSLGVEMQYYLIAPFLSFALIFVKSRTHRVLALIVLISISFISYFSSDSTTQFNSPQCRAWQFLLGSMVAE
ncbi:hypothetical protein PFISCL1PPCAC_2218, partial [Pristionchus fissidentatus]